MVYHGGGHVDGGGGGAMWHLHGALDAGDEDDTLGKVYDIRVIRRLPRYLAWVKSTIGWAATGTLIRTLANLTMPYLVIVGTDNFIKTGNLSGLNIVALVYLGVALLMWGGQYVETLYLSRAGQEILFKMRTQMFGHLHRLSMSFFDHNKMGKIMSRVQNDIDQLQTLLTQDIITLAADIVTLTAIAVIMITMNARLALLTLTVVPVLALVMFIWQRYARRVFIKVRQRIAVVNDNLQESISGVRVTQSLSREQVNSGQFDTVNKAHLDANVEAAKVQAFMMPTVQILTDSAFVVVLVVGGFQVMSGQTTPGVLLGFLLYIQRFFAPVQELAMMYTELQRAMASGARIFELLDVEPEIKDSPQAVELPPLKGVVKFDHVSFGYEPDKEILHDIDLTINPGETVAIAGRTGAGKSSLTSLIARFYEVSNGAILVDGYNVASVTQQSLRRQIGIVPQDPFLFSGTIEDNIRYGRIEASHEEIIEAAKAAGVHDAITHLKHGYDTPVGERGGNLSAGQRQLVCLARAILANPAILILDEATSNVDTNTERIMQESLRHVAQGRTCIIIAHRLSTVTNADRIIVLEHGRVVEVGSHQELMARQGLYYQMFETLSAPTLEQQRA
ncbi:MAG: ABC transporter ATP-binding protein [Chloroflexi bacterium]|nr:ABC transporter ATP-binding protein [Chloroflexota bacterium]